MRAQTALWIFALYGRGFISVDNLRFQRGKRLLKTIHSLSNLSDLIAFKTVSEVAVAEQQRIGTSGKSCLKSSSAENHAGSIS